MSEAFDPQTAFPVPVPDADTEAFWEACREGRLVIQQCDACEAWLWQPRPVCSRCQGLELCWKEVTGAGRVASWMVMRPPTLPAYADKVPFVILLVELDEGVRLVGYLVDDEGRLVKTDGAAEGVTIGRSVALAFHDQAGTVLPSWKLVD